MDMTRHERNIMMSTCFGHFMAHFNMLVFPALVLPLVGRLHLEMAAVLGISFWMYLFFGLTALPWGLAADRWGGGIFFPIFYIGASLGAFSAAVFIDSPSMLTISLAVIGLFSGIYHPVGLGLISKEVQRVSIAMGYNGIFGNLGLATAPLVTGFVNWLWGARAAYVVLGFLNAGGLLLMLFFPLKPAHTGEGKEFADKNGDLRAFLILLVAMMLGGVVYRGGTLILPTYFELRAGDLFQCLNALITASLSKNLMATAATTLIFIIGMLGQYAGGHAAERYDLRYGYLLFHAMTIPAACLMALAWDLPLLALAIVFFFFLLGMQPIENTLVANFTPKRYHHSAFGSKFVLTFGVGAVAVKMVEAIEVRLGLPAVFPALGVTSLLLVGTIIVLIVKTKSNIFPTFASGNPKGIQPKRK